MDRHWCTHLGGMQIRLSRYSLLWRWSILDSKGNYIAQSISRKTDRHKLLEELEEIKTFLSGISEEAWKKMREL